MQMSSQNSTKTKSTVAGEASRRSSAKECTIDPHLVRYMQTALAVSIIKRTPKGQTPEQYTEQLCAQYRQAQLQWKDKAETLKQEVLLLRQQLLEKKWAEDGLLSKSQSSSTDQEVSSQLLFPTPPCSSEDPLDDPIAAHTQKELLTRHAAFLQSVMSLSTISSSTANTPGKVVTTRSKAAQKNRTEVSKAATIDPAFEETTQDSIKSALINLGDVLTNSDPTTPVISSKMVLHMAQVVLNLLDNPRFSQYLRDSVCEMVLCFLWGLVPALLSGISEKRQEDLSTLIVQFSRSAILRPPVTQMLMTQVAQVAKHLRNVTLKSEPLNQQVFQNSCNIFRTLEQILEAEVHCKDKCLTVEFCQGLHKELDSCLLHVWENFQPFALYVWQLQNLVQYIHPGTIVGENGS